MNKTRGDAEMMGTRFIIMLMGVIVGFGVISLITGQIRWGLLIGLLVGVSIVEMRAKSRQKSGEVETDERVESNSRKFMLATMGTSLFLLLIYLMVSDFILNQQFIEIRYLLYYVLATFMVCLFIGPAILKRN
ncbi:MAG TPA: hypothetical protein VK111_11065 [Virgibacillus sp.]|nr:hypothetical protein [Virgibacillus sp.]